MTIASKLLLRLEESIEIITLTQRHPFKPGVDRLPVEVRVSIKPANLQRMLQELRLDAVAGDVDLRLLVDTNDCGLYVWDANLGIHADTADALGLNYRECIRGDADNHNGTWRAGIESNGWRISADQPSYTSYVERVKSVFGNCYGE